MDTGDKLVTVLAQKSYIDKIRSLFGGNLIWFPAMKEQSGTTVQDYSGRGYTGTYSGDVTLANANGPDGQACPTFGGTNSNMLPTAGTITALNGAGVFNPSEFTLGIWFRYNNVTYLNNATSYINAEFGAGLANRIMIYKSAANTIRVYFALGASSVNRNVLTAFTALTWQSVIMTGSVSNNKFIGYANGTAVGADQAYPADAFVGALSASWCRIGDSNGAPYFPGNMALLFLTNSYCTPAQAASAGKVAR